MVDIATSGVFNGASRKLAEALVEVVTDLKDYWPLTVRQAYYQAVAKRLIPNRQTEYQRVSRILAKLRRHDLLPWQAIEDRTRRTIDKRGVHDVQTWAAEQMETFFNWRYYHRCYVQNQSVYVEVATEKDALSSILEEAVWMYCTRLNVVRGQVSATMVRDMAGRYDKAVMRGLRPVLLYLGDLDPSGIAIPKALKRNLLEHYSIDVEVIRVALNADQVAAYSLPASLDAAKRSDPNYSTWAKEHGNQSPVELDALHPRDLAALTETALQEVYDMGECSLQQEKERDERMLIKRIRADIECHLMKAYPNVFEVTP